MLFEVIRDGKVLLSTDHEECIPTPEELCQMMDAGYLFRKEGKPHKPNKRKTQKKKKDD